jgi:short-subunit dehydrogenase
MTLVYTGTRALIRAASSGSQRSLGHGADVVLVARAQPAARGFADEIRYTTAVAVDVTLCNLAKPEAGALLTDRIAQFRPVVDILINSAG